MRVFGLTALIALAGLPVSKSAEVQVTIPAGTRLVGTLAQSISSEETSVGRQVEVRTKDPLWVGDVKVPAGVAVRGEVVEAKEGGRVTGEAAVSIRFSRLEVQGREYSITAEPFRVVGKSEGKNSLKKVIGGTIIGGVAGGITGNVKKGAVLGAIVGSGAAVATKGGHLTLNAGDVLEVRLSEPVEVSVRSRIAATPR